MGMIPIRCTACGEAAQIDEAWLGQLVECPHCHQPTPATLAPLPPSSPPAVPPPPPAMKRVPRPELADVVIEPKPAAPKPAEPKPAAPPPKRLPLTRDQRLAIRRRRQLVIAFGGGVILIIALFALLSLRG